MEGLLPNLFEDGKLAHRVFAFGLRKSKRCVLAGGMALC